MLFCCCYCNPLLLILCTHNDTENTHNVGKREDKKSTQTNGKKFFSQAQVENASVIPRVCKRCRRETCASKLQVLIRGLWCQQGTMLWWVTLSGFIKIMGRRSLFSAACGGEGQARCIGKQYCEEGHAVHCLITEVRMFTFRAINESYKLIVFYLLTT